MDMSKRTIRRIRGFAANESGQSTTEYVLLIALIIVPIAAAIRQMKDPLINLADSICKLLDGPGL